MKQISSDTTIIYKFLFPLIFVFLLGIPVLLNIPTQIETFFFWLFFSAIILSTVARSKKISFDGEYLEISNYFKSEKLHISKLKSVSGSIFIKPEMVWISLYEESSFGKTLMFIPNMRFLSGWTEHPIVEELKKAKIANYHNSIYNSRRKSG